MALKVLMRISIFQRMSIHLVNNLMFIFVIAQFAQIKFNDAAGKKIKILFFQVRQIKDLRSFFVIEILIRKNFLG